MFLKNKKILWTFIVFFNLGCVVAAVSIKVKRNYSSQSEAELEQNVKDKATKIITHLNNMKSLINNEDSDDESVKQIRSALSSRESICSLDEREYIKKIDLNNIKSNFNEKYLYYQTDFYLKLQKDMVNMLSVYDIGKKYSEDYPNYINSYALKIKSTIDNYPDCSSKNLLTKEEYETFLKNFRSYENETIDQFQNKIKKDLASL